MAGGFGFKGVEATAYEVDEKLHGHLKQHLAAYSKVQAEVIAGDYIELATVEDLQAKGYSMGSMALNMMKTAEGQARGWALTGDPVNDVEMLYQGLLGRASDAGGKAAWVQLLKSGFMSLDQVATAFIESPEMKTHYIGPTGWDFFI